MYAFKLWLRYVWLNIMWEFILCGGDSQKDCQKCTHLWFMYNNILFSHGWRNTYDYFLLRRWIAIFDAAVHNTKLKFKAQGEMWIKIKRLIYSLRNIFQKIPNKLVAPSIFNKLWSIDFWLTIFFIPSIQRC